MNWFKKSALELDEYKTLLKRYTDIEARVLSLETSNEVFRNQVLRKVQIQTEKPKELNRPDGGIIRYGYPVKDFKNIKEDISTISTRSSRQKT